MTYSTHTDDRLTDPNSRSIVTRFTTQARVEGDNPGVWVVALETFYAKPRKQLWTTVYAMLRTEDGFLRRSFVVLEPSVGAGLTLHVESLDRFSAKRAREVHGFASRTLLTVLGYLEDRQPAVARELLDMLAA